MPTPNGKTLLFAEDEPELLEIYSEWFRMRGYTVLGATNGKDALTVCESQPVDLVISDVRMAEGDGIELARGLKATLENSPLIVFLTGFADVSSEETYDLGVCSILNKPIDRAELVRAVERFLRTPRELWAAPVSLQPQTKVEKNFESLEAAIRQGHLNFGRGGFFVRNCEGLPENQSLEFNFNFSEKRIPKVDGCGILRWKRTVQDVGLPKGVGIEILSLGHQALDAVTEWISNVRPKAFIPRGGWNSPARVNP